MMREQGLHHNTRVAGDTLVDEDKNVSSDSNLNAKSSSLIHRTVEKGQLTGHSSAASLPTGPVMAEPFISPFGLTICRA